MSVTADHIATYQREGCVHVPGVFSQDWIDRLSDLVLRLDAQMAAGEAVSFTDNGVQNPPTRHDSGDGAVQLRNMMTTDALFTEWLHNSPAAETVGRLMGASHVRFWMDATFIKRGGEASAATPWHNDVCTFPFWGEHLPSFWVALTDVDADNAPLITLAGSNHDPHRYHSPLSRQDITVEGYRPWSELTARVEARDADIRVWPAKAGDILLVHPKTIHGSLPRAAGKPGLRMAFTTRWIGSDVTYAPDALSAAIPKLYDNPLMVPGSPPPEALFPVIWRAA
jgi:ectoine hydroxylase-related dioxygenase (phytanoyl-CoA dioxygenase family)